MDHGDAMDRRRYLHDKLIGAANNRRQEQAVLVCQGDARKSYDTAPHARDFQTSMSDRRVLSHDGRWKGNDPAGF